VFPPLYPRWSNTVFRLALIALVLGAASIVIGPMIYVRTPYNTSQFVPWDQPVEFDHRHHVRDDGIECLYCHSAAERSANAGVPSTEVCMGCHAQIWNQSPLLEVVRRSYFSGTPINWKRVHDLPDFVYFDHSVHVTQGIDCVHCHGDVGRMPRVMQVQPLTMGWCVDCHRESAIAIPPPSAPVNAWTATLDMLSDAPATNRAITPLTTCTACHR
jgi:predicted CXXCH cytochrome family protein